MDTICQVRDQVKVQWAWPFAGLSHLPLHALVSRSRRNGPAAIAILAWLLLSSVALAQIPVASEPRLALVIGNASYRSSPLANPVNDARLMETALKNAGFQVLKAENANRRDMQRLIRDFGEKLKRSGGVGLFYFAGHGMQVRGNNYLIPLDADIRSEDEVAFDSIDAQSVLEKMESAGNRVNLLILDACRDNPFIRNSRSAAVGLATMSAPSGSLIAYSTAPGAVANDGTGRNGLYTEHLARMMAEPGLPVEDVFKQVRVAVRRASNNQQTPWENTALEGRFYFKVPIESASIPSPVAQPQPPRGTDGMAADMAFWDSIKGANKPAELKAYLAQFPNGLFAGLARARLPESQDAPASPVTASAITAVSISTPAVVAAPEVPPARPPAVATIATPRPPPGSPIIPASATASPSVPMDQTTTQQVLILRDRLTGLEKMRIEVTRVPANKGVDRWNTGDEIAADGQVRAVRLGAFVATVQTGALWRFPLQVGSAGSATVSLLGYSRVGTVNWRVTGKQGRRTTVEAKLEYWTGISNGRIVTWNGEYQDGSFIALSHMAEDRGTGSGGSVDITIGELKPITSEVVQTLSPAMATPIAQTPGNQTGTRRPLTDVLILRDKLTGLEQQRIEVKEVQADSNGTRWTTGDDVAANGQVRAVRLGTYVATAETGSLWRLPLQVGTSGSASVRVPGQTARATLDWRVTGKQGDRTTVEGKLLLPANGGTWTLQYQDGVALAVNQSTEFRSPSPNGMIFIAGQLQTSPSAAPVANRGPGG